MFNLLKNVKPLHVLSSNKLLWLPAPSRRLMSIVASKTRQKSEIPNIRINHLFNKINLQLGNKQCVPKEEIEALLKMSLEAEILTETTSLNILKCCGALYPRELPVHSENFIHEVWSKFEESGIKFSTSHYNTLLRMYVDIGKEFCPEKFIAIMEEKGFSPNFSTYYQFIYKYCQEGKISEATTVLKKMKELEMSVDVNIYNSLIMGYAKAGDMDSASNILNIMNDQGIVPMNDTYSQLLVSYAEQGDIDKVKQIIEEKIADSIHLTSRDICEIIYAFSSNEHQEHVPQMLEYSKKNMGYMTDHLNITLRLVNDGFLEAAYKILIHNINNRPTKEATLNDQLMRGFLQQLIKTNQDFDDIIHYCHLIHQLDKGSFNPFTEYLGSLLQSEQTDVAYKLMKIYKEYDIEIRPHYLYPLLIQYGKSGQIDKMFEACRVVIYDWDSLKMKFFRDCLVPFILPLDTSEIIAHCENSNIPKSYVLTQITSYNLLNNRIEELKKFIESDEMVDYSEDLLHPMSIGYSDDCEAMAQLIACMVSQWESSSKARNTGYLTTLVVQNIINRLQHLDKLQSIQPLFTAITKYELTIPYNDCRDIVAALPSDATPEMITTILQMGEKTAFIKASEVKHNLNADQQMLLKQIELENIEEVTSLIQAAADDGTKLNPGTILKAMKLYAKVDQPKYAIRLYEDQNKQFNFTFEKVDSLLLLVRLLLQNDCTTEALKTIKNFLPKSKAPFSLSKIYNVFWEISKNSDLETFNSFKQAFADSNTYLDDGSLQIPYFLAKEDVDEALNAFQVLVDNGNTPFKFQLFKHIVELKDANKLQVFMALLQGREGKDETMHYVTVMLLFMGQKPQAAKIVKNYGITKNPRKLLEACFFFHKTGKISAIQDLIYITKDVHSTGRTILYEFLLECYIKSNSRDKAKVLLDNFEMENIMMTPSLSDRLNQFIGEESPDLTKMKYLKQNAFTPKKINERLSLE